jgi:membrane-associated phospholipid phosphatase
MVVEQRTGWAPLRHFAERSVLGFAAVVAAGLGFGTLLLLVRYHWSPLLHLDQSVANGLNRVVSADPAAVQVATAISHLGGRGTLIPLVVLAIVVLLIRRLPRLALYLAVTGIGALILDPSLKTLVGRVRPVVADPVAHGPGNSFPSGHALGSMVVYGMLTLVFLAVVRHRWRGWFVALAALIVAAIGASRVALGVHFVSDVLAGWLLGAAWICVTAYAFRVWRRETGHPTISPAEGLEPEAEEDLAPFEPATLPHPWAKGAEILVGWTLMFGLLYVVGYLLTHVIPSGPDNAVPRWLQTFRTPTLDHLSWLGSKAGDTHAILAISLVFCPLALALWRQWRPVLFVVLTMVGEITLFLCSAAAVGRPRPPVAQLDGQMPTSSFPSGHIAATLCLWTAIAIVVTGRVRQWWRWVFVGLAIVMPSVVALSRMYRGEHHPTDALGAALLAAGWISVVYWTVLREGHDVEPAARRARPASRDHPVDSARAA